MEYKIKGTMHKYVYGYLEIDEFFTIYDAAIKDSKHSRNPRFTVSGQQLYLYNKNYKLFKRKGVTCVNCNRSANLVVVEGTGHKNFIDANFYHVPEDPTKKAILMTKDHRVPRALGGKDMIPNYNVMCARCNNKKADKIDPTLSENEIKQYSYTPEEYKEKYGKELILT